MGGGGIKGNSIRTPVPQSAIRLTNILLTIWCQSVSWNPVLVTQTVAPQLQYNIPLLPCVNKIQLYCQVSIQYNFTAKCQYNTTLLPSVNTVQLYCQVSIQYNFIAKCQYNTTLLPSVNTIALGMF